MNIIEKRKSQLKILGMVGLAISSIALIAGILLTALSNSNTLMIVFGILLIVAGVIGAIASVVFVWMASAVKATKGSIAEENLGIGTVNMIKCKNCGVEVEEGQEICKKCEENLK